MITEEDRERGKEIVKGLGLVCKSGKKGGTIGIGFVYWLSLRMLRVYKFIHGLKDETRKNILRKGYVGYWKGYRLRIIRNSFNKEGMNEPKVWKKEYE